ncbi:MAG: hypothetical protein AAGF95_04655 [Chloroflexota bacterium]
MPGSLKSGLLFGIIGLVLVIAVSFIPGVGALLCAPLFAGLIGLGAGYFGVKWGKPEAGVGTGTVAGLLSGIGLLIGAIIFFVLAITLVQSDPQFQIAFEEAMADALATQPDTEIDPAQLPALLSIGSVIAGFCVGLIYLLFALGFGALGGWLAVRNRPQVSEYNQQPPMSPPPSSGPPPMSPMG